MEEKRNTNTKGGECMLNNLKAEMVRNGVSAMAIADAIGRTSRTVRDKIIGRCEFYISEAIAIRARFFPGMSLEYLFADDSRNQSAAKDERKT